MCRGVIYRLVSLVWLVKTVSAGCYFPFEVQGTYLIQTQASAAYGGSIVTYSELTIEVDAIPPWGRCHLKRGNNVIVKDSTGAEDCLRCFHLTLKTPNVIQIHTEGLGRCYTNEEAARATCPDDRDVFERRFKEIILYRKQDPDMVSRIQDIFCPINGIYRFTYTANNGEFQCTQSFSELSNCPHGNGLGVSFRHCNFPDMNVRFLCLGDWEGPNNDRYLALMDLRAEPEARPRYRCGLYRKNPQTGQIKVSLAADSTCTTQLRSSSEGYESLILSPVPEQKLPPLVDRSHCRFPDWSQGRWEHLDVDGRKFVFRDGVNFQTITATCIHRENNTPHDRFLVYAVTQCGEASYNCVWLQRRTNNIVELMIGSRPSSHFSEDLCRDQQFPTKEWITEGRTNVKEPTTCPITGDYFGVVPDTTGLCAKVASDCNNPDIMFYSVSSCANRSHVYEERVYRCIGNWEENGALFTFTTRQDIKGHQCFVGKVMKNGDEAYIKEAGETCTRGQDPITVGMKITKQVSCPQVPVTFVPVRPPWRSELTPPTQDIGPSGGDSYWYQRDNDRPTSPPRKTDTGQPSKDPAGNSGMKTISDFLQVTYLLLLVKCARKVLYDY
ncbi:uncharacterized protein LOC106469744 [Limulus polyphemus]|uniref:Uncharacterized protein LOC106469744 n=1 Tax=Limulus polyphemus TaxID=6850 RepID=A0ABM1TDQ3_LIMPO|nr:uncharacterized protein LOC106469744 [Limulus polyphemus]